MPYRRAKNRTARNPRRRRPNKKSRKSTRVRSKKDMRGQVTTNHGQKLSVKKMNASFPDIALVKLHQSDRYIMTSTSGVHTRNTWRNSLYDPYYTGVGSQPLSYDQWATLYENYQVTDMAYDFLVVGDATSAVRLCVTTQEDDTAWSNFEQALQQDNTTKEIICLPGQKVRLKGYVSGHKVLGTSRDNFVGDADYVTAIASNPSVPFFIQLIAQTIDESTTSSVNVIANFYMYTRLSDKAQLAESS